MRVARTRGVLMSGGHEQSSGTVSNDHERYLPTEEPAGIRRTGKACCINKHEAWAKRREESIKEK